MIAEMIKPTKPVKEKKSKSVVATPERKAAGDRLRFVRKNTLGISSSYEMAKQLGMAQSTYVSCELGILEIGMDFLTALYSKYNVLSSYILLGVGPIQSTSNEPKSTLMIDVKKMTNEMETLKNMVEYLSRRVRDMEDLKSDVIRLEQRVDGLS